MDPAVCEQDRHVDCHVNSSCARPWAARGCGRLESADVVADSGFGHSDRRDCDADPRIGSTSPIDRLVAGTIAIRADALRCGFIFVRDWFDLLNSLARRSLRPRDLSMENAFSLVCL